jgi:hypothetical protein
MDSVFFSVPDNGWRWCVGEDYVITESKERHISHTK